MPIPTIADLGIMEDFFRKHLKLLGADKLVRLEVFRHDPKMVFDQRVTLVKYELDLTLNNGTPAHITLRGSSGADDKREKSFHILQALWRNGFSSGIYSIPKPIGYFPEHGLLLYFSVPGSTLMEQLESGKNHLSEKIKVAIDWLAAFHARKPADVPEAHFYWEKERGNFNKLVDTICTKYATHCDRIRSVVDALVSAETKLLNPKGFSLIHGDYQPNNIITDGISVKVIDFNDAYLFDELYDLSYFVTQVKYMLKRFSLPDLDTELAKAIKTYLEARNIEDSTLTWKKIHLFKAKSLISIKALTTYEQGLKILEEIESHAANAI